ncbi:hypothetical protein [Candidatus Formimonas warabiya]|uniref:Uncharacterized protein n=1 Tax=Formimonas warabiya TaxID=1761012 RepID=A0A3G1KS42_FORW1|nr:hypothetical protein [Candidatus Formimonas warabiya]ATW25281.1 hypothetical protein DCMF_11335 [Candidatus Formimonas warabiya]
MLDKNTVRQVPCVQVIDDKTRDLPCVLMVKVNNQTVQTNTYDLADRLLTQKDGNKNTINFEGMWRGRSS